MSSLLILATKHLYYANFTSLIQINSNLVLYNLCKNTILTPNKGFYIKKINFLL